MKCACDQEDLAPGTYLDGNGNFCKVIKDLEKYTAIYPDERTKK